MLGSQYIYIYILLADGQNSGEKMIMIISMFLIRITQPPNRFPINF